MMGPNQRIMDLLLLSFICLLHCAAGIAPPANLTITNEGSTDSLKATWTPPSDATKQTVTWFLATNNTELGSADGLLPNATTYLINGSLTAGTLYNVTVTAKNGTTDTASATEQGRTLPSPVVNLRESAATNDSISAVWDAPGGQVDNYTVTCPPDYENTTTNELSAECDGLPEAGAVYTITVTSLSGGERSTAESLDITALPNKVVLIPGDSTNSSFNVSWLQPDGQLDRFQIVCDNNDGQAESIDSDGNSLSEYEVECAGLPTAGQNYSISVLSISGDKNVTVNDVLYTLPNQVTLVEGEATVSTVRATWSKPIGQVSSYTITCPDGATPSPASVNQTDGVMSFSAECVDLAIPGDSYTMNVISVSNGKSSDPASMINLRALPSPITDLAESGSTTNSINATWSKPIGVLDRYNVICSAGIPDYVIVPDNYTVEHTATGSCTNLSMAGADYDITVTSVSAGQESDPSTQTIRTVPLPVTDLTESGATTDSVSVTWTTPNATELDSYRVECPVGPNKNITEDGSDSYDATCSDLPEAGDNYTVTVITISGTKESEAATVTITALPLPVADLMESGATTDSVSVNWTKPVGTGVDSYRVECPDGSTQTKDDSGSYDATCSNLTVAGDNYTVTVITISGTKESEAATVNITAYPNSVELEATDITTETITVTWDDPDGEEDRFEVDCGNDNSIEFTLYPSDEFEVTCSVTKAGEPYAITVTSFSGDKSNATTATFDILEPMEVDITATFSTTTSITVTWDAIPSADSFSVSCSDGTPSPSPPLDGAATTATCTGVTPGGNHSITIVTTDNNAESSPVETFIPAYPLPVTLNETDANTTSVSVTWEAPGGTVGSYLVTCPGDSGTTREYNAPQIVTCVDLDPGTDYNVTAKSVSNNLESDVSELPVTTVPLVVTLVKGTPTNTSVQANVTTPQEGTIESVSFICSEGTANPLTIDNPNGTQLASCVGLPTAGQEYNLTATSISGSKTNSIQIVLRALPNQVTLESGTSTVNSVEATWSEPAGVISEYQIACDPGDPMPINILNNSSEPFSAQCENLTTPGGNYTMTVTSVSGDETNAESIVLTALPEAVILAENATTTDSVTAEWARPNGIVEDYKVECSAGMASNVTDSENGDMLMVTCKGLPTPGANYTVSVTSESNGQESATSSITITAVPIAVELEEGESNTTTISATWKVQTRGENVVDTFEITCSNGTPSPESFSEVQFLVGKTLTAYCLGLPTAGLEYDLSVVSVSNDKKSVPAIEGVFALPNGVELTAGPSTTTTVSATWGQLNGSVESFNISCDHGDPSPSTIEYDESLTSYEASCMDLPGPGDTYIMTVYSIVNDILGTSSIIHLVAVPESVESIEVESYNTTSITVTWTLKNCSSCVYTSFNLSFEPDSDGPITFDYDDGGPYNHIVNGLTQGRSFNFTIETQVSEETTQTSAPKSVMQRTKPEAVTAISIVPDKTSLALSWEPAEGDEDSYIISISPNEGSAIFNNDLENPEGNVTGLTPGVEYVVSIVTVSGDETSEAQEQDTRTLPDTPSPVRNARAVEVDKSTIEVSYESPESPNGIIETYYISYTGTRNDLPMHEGNAEIAELAYTFSDLRAGFTYIFMISAENDGGYRSEEVATEAVTTPQEVPSEVDPDYPYEENTETSDISKTSFGVVLPDDLFSHDNGQLETFSVIISLTDDNDAVNATTLTYDQAVEAKVGGVMPPYITVADVTYPYPPVYNSSSRRRRRSLVNGGYITIGDGQGCDVTDGYCNAKLADNTQYYYAFRASNEAGSVTSQVFEPVTTVKDNTVGIAVGVVVSLIAVAVVVVASFVVYRRRKSHPDSGNTGQENPGFVGDHQMGRISRQPGTSLHRKPNSKPILLSQFPEHCRMMKADSEFKFTEEYDALRPVGRDQPIGSATLDVNKPKNRFTNILPYEHSRVKLAAIDDEHGTDYINANYMPGYNSPREFIACQGPLPGTLDDMWRMIWEKKAKVIVMLTQLVEKGKIKCHQYWPENYDPIVYGTIEVSLQAEQQYEHWIIREFSLLKGDQKRKVTQFHFMSWPDHGVPADTWCMLDFVRTVREHIHKEGGRQPVIGHCSAGVGRTGTYIALDRLRQHMQEHDYIDIYGIVCEMRKQRNYMVQTEKQYIFIHESVLDLLERGNEAENEVGENGEAIYVNVGMNGDVNENLLDQQV